MGFSDRCGVCTHPYAVVINDMLAERARGDAVTARDIIAKMADLGAPISETQLSRHAKNHFNPTAVAREKAAKALSQYSTEQATEMVEDVVFLDLVKSTVHERVLSGEITPTVSDAIRAVATKHTAVLKDGDPLAALMGSLAESAGAEG